MTTNVTSPALYALGAVTTVGLVRRDRARAVVHRPHPAQTVPRKMNMATKSQPAERASPRSTARRDRASVRLTKQFGNTYAVQNIDLTIPHGSYCCLLGPSAAAARRRSCA